MAMDPFSNFQHLSAWQDALLTCVVVLIVLAVVNYALARQAERKHPPTGSFIEVDGIKLHYSDRGQGRDPDIRRHLALHDLAGFWLAHDAADQAHDVRALVDDQKVQGRIFHGHGAAAVPDPGHGRRRRLNGPERCKSARALSRARD